MANFVVDKLNRIKVDSVTPNLNDFWEHLVIFECKRYEPVTC